MNRFFYFVFLSFLIVFLGCMSDAGNNIQRKNENFASVLLNEEDKKTSLSLLDKLQVNKDLSEDAYREKILENLEKEKNKKEDRFSSKIKENLENILKRKNFEKKDKENVINILEEYKKYLNEGDKIFLKIKYDNKLGYINSFGEILIPPILEGSEIGNYNSKYVWVKSPPKFFIMDNDFNTICSSEKLDYDDIYNFSEGIALVRKNSKYGYIDKNGKLLVLPAYEDGTNFNSNVAFVKEDNLWGMINKTGKFIIKPYYDWVWGSENDYYAVKKNNYYGIVNKNGEVVVETKYDWVEILKDKNRAILSLEGKEGCVDLKSGKTLINFDYEDILYISQAERFIMKKDALYCICDENGKTLGSGYDNLYNDYYFSYYFYFTKNYNYGIIDKNDELILKEDRYAFLKIISKDKKLIAVRKFEEDYCRIIDFSGKETSSTRYSSIDKFASGFFSSEKNGKYGLIDDNFNEVLPPVYDNILRFEKNGGYRISKNNLYGIADDKGKIIVEPKYESIYEEGKFISVIENGRKGFIDIEGKILFPAEYSQILVGDEGKTSVCKIAENYYFYDVLNQKKLEMQYSFINDYKNGFVVGEEKKRGIFDFNLNKVIPFLYDEIDYYKDDLFFAVKNNLKGIINSKNEVVLDFKYQDISKVPENTTSLNEVFLISSEIGMENYKKVLSIKENDKYGFINLNNEIVIKPRFDEIRQFNENLIRAREGDKWGLVEVFSGKIVSEPKYDFIGDIYDGVALCYNKTGGEETPFIDKKWGALNEKGDVIASYSSYLFDINTIIGGYAIAKRFVGRGYDDDTGNEINYCVVEVIDKVGNRVCTVSDFFEGKYSYGLFSFYGKISYSLDDKKWGIKDYEGKVVFEPSFDKIVRFDYNENKLEEKTYFQKNGKTGMIDKDFNILIEPKYESLSEFTKDLTRAERGGYVYLIDDKTGEEKSGPFKDIGWGEKYITMRSPDNLYGYITNEGETVISPQFHDATRFIKTIAGVKINNKWGVIDLTGNLIVKANFDSISVEETEIIRCNVKNKIGYINTVGLKIFEIWKPSN